MVTERGLTLLLTSHDLGDIEHLCPRMIMIDQGLIVHDGPFSEITRQFGWEDLWAAAYASRPAIAGYDWDDMRTYIVIAFGHNALVGWRVASTMGNTIKSGDVVLEFSATGSGSCGARSAPEPFDRVLVRPISPAIQQMGSLASIHGLGNAGMGVTLLGFALPRAGVDLHWWTIPLLLLTCFCAALLTTWRSTS